MDETAMLALAKKSMLKHQGRKKYWQVKQVYKSFRDIPWSKWDSIKGLLDWWRRICPCSNMSRMTRTINSLERDIADNELQDIKELFGLDVPLYSLAKALKKREMWIPINEQLPESGKQVFLIDSETRYAYVGWMNKPKEWWFYNVNQEEDHPEKTITHWKPISMP